MNRKKGWKTPSTIFFQLLFIPSEHRETWEWRTASQGWRENAHQRIRFPQWKEKTSELQTELQTQKMVKRMKRLLWLKIMENWLEKEMIEMATRNHRNLPNERWRKCFERGNHCPFLIYLKKRLDKGLLLNVPFAAQVRWLVCWAGKSEPPLPYSFSNPFPFF